MATPRQLVEAPAVVPYRYGLFSVAQPRQTELTEIGADPHWRNGITWVSQACGDAKITQEFCVQEADPALVADDLCSIAQFDPFTVYAYNNDSLVGFSLAEHEGNAVARLLNGEQFASEVQLWEMMTEAVESCEDYTTVPAFGGLGAIEQELAAAYGGQGVLHMNRATATALCDNLYADGQIMRTKLGTPVVVGGGYGTVAPAGPGLGEIYATGPVIIYRGEVDTRQNAINKPTNNVSIVAQRDYVLGWDCNVVCVTVNLCNICLPEPPVGPG
jgi:hypothetical protein